MPKLIQHNRWRNRSQATGEHPASIVVARCLGLQQVNVSGGSSVGGRVVGELDERGSKLPGVRRVHGGGQGVKHFED